MSIHKQHQAHARSYSGQVPAGKQRFPVNGMGGRGRDRQMGRRDGGGREGGVDGDREAGSGREGCREARVRGRSGGQEVREGTESRMDGSAQRTS